MAMNRRRNEAEQHKKKLILAVAVLSVILAVCIGLCIYMESNRVAPSVTVEAGAESVAPGAFQGWDKRLSLSFVTDMSQVDLSKPGDYPVKLRCGGKTYSSVLKVRDTVAPAGTAVDQTVPEGKQLKPEDFVTGISDKTKVTVRFKNVPDMTKADQTVTVILQDMGGNTTSLVANLKIKFDDVAPQIKGVTDRKVFLGAKNFDLLAGVTVEDNVDPEPKLSCDSSSVNTAAAGEYTVTYTATDSAGNVTKATAKVTVAKDTTAPKIHGAKDLYVYVGGTVAYRSGVSVSDDMDTAPVLTVDNSGVNLQKAGTYYVTYSATDGSGNKSSVSIKLVVSVKPAENLIVSEETINEMADSILSQILRSSMTTKQKVEKIYTWANTNIRYTGTSDKADWKQEAYRGMKNRSGDCFTYYAVVRLMLERLEIPNIDVVKVKNYPTDSNHYWSLVSVDGGQTYYHLDATPRVGTGDNFCLVTDAFLDAYSKAHNNCHNRDMSLYPATPTEDLA